jgi:predicted homoserine dehydrogenase-like protein
MLNFCVLHNRAARRLSENAQIVHSQQLLPIGLAEGCRLRQNIARNQVLAYADVELRPTGCATKLRLEQDALLFGRLPSLIGRDSLVTA